MFFYLAFFKKARQGAPAAPSRRPRTSQNTMNQAKKGGIAFILITLILDTLGIGVIIPISVRLVAEFVGGDLVEASKYTGPFTSTYAAMLFFFAPIVAGISDRYGRRPVILIAALGMGTNYILQALAPTLSWLFVGRIIAGITGASFSSANAYTILTILSPYNTPDIKQTMLLLPHWLRR